MQHDERTSGRRVEPEELLGRVLRDEFRLDACLGAGGMSVVYRARQLTVDRDVVVKVMSTPSARAAEFRQRFVQEARTASRVKHPGIVTIYSFGEEDGVGSFIAMELVDGASLRALAASGPMDISRASGLIAQVCRAIHAAHSAGIVHRDLKPDNIMVERREGREIARVLDFGIAKPNDALVKTLDEHVVGTPDYMAPEQARKRPVDARTDVYSVGIILYELVFGRRPFDAPDPLALMFKHVHAPLPLDDWEAPWPAEFREVLETACAKDPADRYATAKEMAEELGRFADGSAAEPLHAMGPTSDAIEVVSTPEDGVKTDPMGNPFDVVTAPMSPSESMGTAPIDVEESIDTTVHRPLQEPPRRIGPLAVGGLIVGLVVVVVVVSIEFVGGAGSSATTETTPGAEHVAGNEPLEVEAVRLEDPRVDVPGGGEPEEQPAWRASVVVQNATSRATGVAEGVARGSGDDIPSPAKPERSRPPGPKKDGFEFERMKPPEKEKPKLLSIE